MHVKLWIGYIHEYSYLHSVILTRKYSCKGQQVRRPYQQYEDIDNNFISDEYDMIWASRLFSVGQLTIGRAGPCFERVHPYYSVGRLRQAEFSHWPGFAIVFMGALKTREAAPYSRGGKRGEIRRPKKKWNMLKWTTNASRHTWQDMTTGHAVVFSSWRPWATQWVLTLKHCVLQWIAPAAAMRMRRHRRLRQRQTRHYDMILWLYNSVVDFS